MNYLAFLDFFFSQQDSQQCRFAGSVTTDETDFHVIDQAGVGPVEQDLITETFESVTELNQNGHFSKIFLYEIKSFKRQRIEERNEKAEKLHLALPTHFAIGSVQYTA